MISHLTTVSRIEWDDIFAIEIPDSWAFSEEDGVVSIFDENNGVGVIQISFAKRNDSDGHAKQEAFDLAKNYAEQRNVQDAEKSIHLLSVNGSPVSVFEFESFDDDDLEYWRIWHVIGKNRIGFITYNCSLTDKLIEEKVVDMIISSFYWK